MTLQNVMQPILEHRIQTSTAASVAMSTERQLMFTSEYYFKSEAIAEVREKFKTEIEARQVSAKLNYVHTKHAFFISCPPGELKMVWKIFHTILATMINEECRKSASLTRYEDSLIEEEEDESEADDDDDDDDGDDNFDEDFVLRSTKIERLDIWMTQNESQTIAAKSMISSLDYPVEIQKLEFKHNYAWDETSLTMDDVFTDLLLDELKRMTRCTFSKNHENNSIFIGSDTKEDLSIAISKIKNIIKSYLQLSIPFIYHILYTEADTNVEFAFLRLSNAKNRLFKTTLLNPRRESFDIYQEIYQNSVTIRYALHDSFHDTFKISWKLKITPIHHEKTKSLKLGVWDVPKYSARRPQNADSKKWVIDHVTSTPSIKIPNTASKKFFSDLAKQNTMNWIENVVNLDPIRVSQNKNLAATEPIRQWKCNNSKIQGTRGSVKPSWDSFQEPVPKAFQRNLDIMVDRPSKVLAKDLKNQNLMQNVRRTNIEKLKITQKPHVPTMTKTNHSSISNQPQQLPHLLDSNPDIEINDSFLKPLSPIISSISTLIPLSDSSACQRTDSRSYTTQEIFPVKNFVKNIMDEDDNGFDSFSYDVLTPTRGDNLKIYHPAVKSHDLNKETADNVSMSTAKEVRAGLQASVSQENEQNPKIICSSKNNKETKARKISRSFAEIEIQKEAQESEKIKIKKESSSQPTKVPTTVGLSQHSKSPSAPFSVKSSKGDLLENFRVQIHLSFNLMMERLRNYRGSLAIEANFGRIVIKKLHDRHIANKNLPSKTFTEEKTREILEDIDSSSGGLEFTKILTAKSNEIEQLIIMKNSHGYNYWIPERNDTSLIYELCFSDKRNLNSRFIIEINAENFASRIKTSSELGNIYIHGTKRFWDFRLSATGTGRETELSTLHGELKEMILRSLFIPEGCTSPDLRWEIKEFLDSRYSLEGVTVRHIGHYIGKDNELVLQICEVHLLEVSSMQSPDRNSVIFHASHNSENGHSSQDHSMWFEVSIKSSELEALLIKNQVLELGELADWANECLDFGSISQNIFLSACSMLERLDGIGSYNDNGYDMESNPIAIPNVSSRPFYW